MTKNCIWYTHNKLNSLIMKICQEQLKKSFDGKIISVSLRPINFGKNIVLDLKPGIITMYKQILVALEASEADAVFFCEHDVLYHKSHFDFEPLKDDTFYYNTNVWQWKFPEDFAITYDNIRSLSNLCVNRRFAINHYKKRLKLIDKKGWEDTEKEPYWAKRMGYEPGTKSKRQELVSKDASECRKSKYPNIDIRHSNTFSPTKMKLKHFKHPPEKWRETTLDKIEGWNLKQLFN